MSKPRPDPVLIKLVRGSTGLGFNIQGGIDQPHLPNDNGIFVTKIREIGSAAKDGRLKEGDKIIEINGNSLLNVKHAKAVDLFINAGVDVELLVWANATKRLVEEYNEKQKRSKGMSPLTKVLLIASVVSFVVAIYYWKSKPSVHS